MLRGFGYAGRVAQRVAETQRSRFGERNRACPRRPTHCKTDRAAAIRRPNNPAKRGRGAAATRRASPRSHGRLAATLGRSQPDGPCRGTTRTGSTRRRQQGGLAARCKTRVPLLRKKQCRTKSGKSTACAKQWHTFRPHDALFQRAVRVRRALYDSAESSGCCEAIAASCV